MAGSVHDSAIYHKLFDAGDASRLFTDSAEVRAMLIVEGALAKAQGSLGIIPELSAAAIHRATLEIPLDPLWAARLRLTACLFQDWWRRFAPKCRRPSMRNICIGVRPRRTLSTPR